MMQARSRTRLFRAPFLLPLALLAAASSESQSISAPAKHKANDVVMVSLEAMNPRMELRQRVGQGLLGDSDAALKKHLLEIQMNIVRETAEFGPVLLLAPDETTKTAVHQQCAEFQICELLKSDRVRVKVVVHDGAWIRDFGPQIETTGDSANVVHWRYFDIRAEEAKREKFQELETFRLKLLETREREDHPDAFTQESTAEARKAVTSTIDDKLYLLREYSQILNEASLDRTNDESSAYDIADAILATPDFNYKNSGLAVDGGNLLKLEDGRCLTTRVLLSRNKDQNINVDEELERVGGCKEITFLEPLPGPVIEHIDMFALPAGGKRILLASYDLAKPFAAEYWSKLSESERDLAMNAELAMELNAERLRRNGYEVVQVPSPFARIPASGHTYYPSVLNALVREGTDGSREVIVPSYKDYETDIQSAALKQIGEAFGPKTEIVTIEATEAAKAQGAVHCLTLTAPLQLSIFGDSNDAARRTESLMRKEQLDQSVAKQVAGQSPAAGLRGLWAIVGKDKRTDDTPLGLYPQRIFFSENEFQKGVFDRLESKGKYSIARKGAGSWSLYFLFTDEDVSPATVQWISKDEVKLKLDGGDDAMVLRRIDYERESPFKQEEQSSLPTGAPAKKHPKRSAPTTFAGQTPNLLQPGQP